MKHTPLHIVRYFKGEETRTLSKHLYSDAAFQVANRFIHNLKRRYNETTDGQVIVSLTQVSSSAEKPTILTLTRRSTGTLDEGVRIDLETQRDPNWDYPKYTDPRESGSGQRTTAGYPVDWPFSLLPK